ncbi:unnamed protein product [Pocillopora meandrina]|uniref:Uncharacterized protein n=1 Tax=Pocillopora meandrina TaxID=46732 RepID=A0AAU9WAV4_9CNID|nr:unnamed protein product [Pocillopora meandrina]
MSDFREALWKNNADPEEAWLKYIRQGSQRQEMINFLTNDFPLCAWSLRMLDRRLIILTYFSMMKNCKILSGSPWPPYMTFSVGILIYSTQNFLL